MNKEVQFKKFFKLTSNVTDVSPKAGARLLDSLIMGTLGNRVLANYINRQAHHKIKEINQFEHILVVSDLNIGDAIIAACGITALRKIFPESEIDFAVKNSTKVIIEGNPEVSNLFPIYNHAPYPTVNDLLKLSKIISSKNYDLIINYCPMIPSKFFGNRKTISYNIMAAELMKNEKLHDSINNINYQSFKLIEKALNEFVPSSSIDSFSGAKIYISDTAVNEARNFLFNHGIEPDKPLIMFNPDASAVYTRMPFDFQINLLKKLSLLNCNILIGAGHVEKLIEQRIVNYFSSDNDKKIIVVPPSTELDTYAALIDLSDVFITGDTGPLHIAAARKISRDSGKSLRNRTAVFSIFGSTPSHIYGYDSKAKNYFPANQDAPSRAFVANTICRNISCINKMAKTCKEVRCFDNLSEDEIVSEVINHFSSIKRFYFPKERSIFAQ